MFGVRCRAIETLRNQIATNEHDMRDMLDELHIIRDELRAVQTENEEYKRIEQHRLEVGAYSCIFTCTLQCAVILSERVWSTQVYVCSNRCMNVL